MGGCRYLVQQLSCHLGPSYPSVRLGGIVSTPLPIQFPDNMHCGRQQMLAQAAASLHLHRRLGLKL